MKIQIIENNKSLSEIIKNFSNGFYDILIEDINNVFITNPNRNDIIIKPVWKDFTDLELKNVINHFKSLNKSSTDIEYQFLTYNIFIINDNNIYCNSLVDIIMNDDKDNPFGFELPNWSLNQHISDNYDNNTLAKWKECPENVGVDGNIIK